MFRIFNHTADIGLLVEGKNKEELFTESATGMFGIMVGGRVTKKSQIPNPESRIEVSGATLEELLVNFLNELLYLSEREKAIFNEFKVKIKRLKNEFYLKAGVKKNRQIPKREIKAATYHDLKVTQKKNNLWQTRIIFDI